AQLYDLDTHSQLIDSPGLQAFGLHHLQASNLVHYLPDMRPYIGKCRFHNCSHRQEPGCALKQAVIEHKIKLERLQFLQNITNELIR
ncbi:MAG: ribosome small subunit-dependent GTPase, partial [Snodgrassella sp.]|nr:ribosome small subunit-dependent GTPase [Snodgrassella sp.]